MVNLGGPTANWPKPEMADFLHFCPQWLTEGPVIKGLMKKLFNKQQRIKVAKF